MRFICSIIFHIFSKIFSHNLTHSISNNSAIFLDRDGTINEELNFISKPENLFLIPKSAEAISEMRKMGFKIFVITNQSGIARGYFELQDLENINKKLIELLYEKKTFVDKIYFCPHIDENNCECRKPKIGMLKKAEREFGIDLKKSFVIGDRFVDINAGQNANAISILVLTGYGDETRKIANENNIQIEHIANDLYESLEIIKKIHE